MRRQPAILFVCALLLPSVLALAAGPPGGLARAWRPAGELTLARPGEPGAPFVLEGRVIATKDSLPLKGVRIHVYHADAHGQYAARPDGPIQLAGDLVSGEHGAYRIRTILPGLAEGTPHVHFELYDAYGDKSTAFTLHLCRTHGAGSDSALARMPFFTAVPKSRHPEYWAIVEHAADSGFACRWDMRVPAALGKPSR